MRMLRRCGLAVLWAALLGPSIGAEDWPEWRGAGRLAVWTEDGIIDRFPAGGLKAAWRTPIKAGFAGPVVAGGRVFVTDFEFLPETPRHGRHGARAGPRRADGRRPLDVRMAGRLPEPAALLRHGTARHADGGRRLRVRCRRRGDAPVPGGGDGRGDLAARHRRGIRHHGAGLGYVELTARRRRPRHLHRWGRTGRARRRVRHRDRRRGLAGDRCRDGNGIRPARHLRGGRRPTAHHLAPGGRGLAQSGDGRRLLAGAGGRRGPASRWPPRSGATTTSSSRSSTAVR